MPDKLRVAIIGCGRMGQHYTDVYTTFEETEVVAIAEYNEERRKAVSASESVLYIVTRPRCLLMATVME